MKFYEIITLGQGSFRLFVIIAGIFILVCSENFMAEHENSFITLGPDVGQTLYISTELTPAVEYNSRRHWKRDYYAYHCSEDPAQP